MNRKLKIFFIISISLNVLLVGMEAGRWLHKPPVPMKKHERILKLVEESSIPDEKRTIITQKLAAMNNEDVRRKNDKLQEESLAILTAENFDAEAYRKNVLQTFALRNQKMDDIANSIVELATHLNLEERRRLAEILRFPPHHREGGRKVR